ncbi:MAG: hypothetical protein IT529_06510 [Burkholderiales bacterium]|nr:hypothetical protein [Burkholderiales bacterium]
MKHEGDGEGWRPAEYEGYRQMTIAGQLARFVTGTTAQDLPPLALERARTT